MECHYAINANANHPAEMTFRSIKEPPGYDFRNIIQYVADPGTSTSGGHVSSSRSSTRLFDMVQASQQLAALNSGSYYPSEYSQGFTSSKSCEACYDSRSPEEADATASKGAATEDQEIPHSQQQGEESALTGLVMEKILRDYFQDPSEPKSHLLRTATHSSTYNPTPTSRDMTEPRDGPLEESAGTSSTQIDFGILSQVPSSSGLPDRLVANSGEFKTDCNYRNWKEHWPSGGAHDGIYDQGPSPSFCGTYRGELKSKIRYRMETDGMEGAGSRPKRRRNRLNPLGSSGETQRMTHIAVERNRRKQMNDHLSALKALMPSAFVHKSDQASIIGGAVAFVKEMEVLLESLLSKQRRRTYAEILGPNWTRFNNVHPGPLRPDAAPHATAGYAPSSEGPTKRTTMSSEMFAELPENARGTNEVRAECKSAAASVEVKVLGSDAMVNITTHWRAKQLVKVITALESLDLSILHTSVTTSKSIVLYTFNAKVGHECRMTVNQVAAALHQTFNGVSYTTHA